MILGIGTDIADVGRIAKSIENESFKNKVFSAAEIRYCETKTNKAENFAARFAAKEALLKALGTGLRGDIAINEIEVKNNELGKPSLHFMGKTADTIASKNIHSIHLSLSHVKELALATVIIEGNI